MPRKRHEKSVETNIPNLPEGWEIQDWEGDYAIVRIHKDDLTKVRLLKLPKEVRDYLREAQSKHREKMKEKSR